ncbi:F-box domain, cyclin-like protein [Artemisia annua]|uniref:F-box domain, cyclin-like protein n=1 Tax=Artemisia annua TaxID=35608 RepID=A0A2U1Q486_ARTAN|nr:F-box domain, cyclin-like protein [Artemisia annua]
MAAICFSFCFCYHHRVVIVGCCYSMITCIGLYQSWVLRLGDSSNLRSAESTLKDRELLPVWFRLLSVSRTGTKKMEIKIDFVAAHWDFAAAFWVIMLSKMYPNDLQVIFLLLVLFSKVSVRYYDMDFSMSRVSVYDKRTCNRVFMGTKIYVPIDLPPLGGRLHFKLLFGVSSWSLLVFVCMQSCKVCKSVIQYVFMQYGRDGFQDLLMFLIAFDIGSICLLYLLYQLVMTKNAGCVLSCCLAYLPGLCWCLMKVLMLALIKESYFENDVGSKVKRFGYLKSRIGWSGRICGSAIWPLNFSWWAAILSMGRRVRKCSWERFLESHNGIFDHNDTISRLPETVLHHVISFLPTSDKDQVRFLSRKWRRMAAQSQKKLSLTGRRLDEQELSRILVDDFHSVDFLSLNRCSGMKTLKLVNFNLKTVELNYCRSLKSLELNTPHLETFLFRGPRIRPCRIEFGICKQLKNMDLSGVSMNNMMFMDCNKTFPLLRVLTLSCCDMTGCIEISSNSLQDLFLLKFNKSIEITVTAPNLNHITYNGSTICSFSNMNVGRLFSANIELYRSWYHKRNDTWFRNLNEMLQCLKLAKRLVIETNSEKNIIIPKKLRQNLMPPLDETDVVLVYITSRTRDTINVVHLADSMLWISPRLRIISVCLQDDEAIALGLVDSGSNVTNPMEGLISQVMVFLLRELCYVTRYRKVATTLGLYFCYGCYFHQLVHGDYSRKQENSCSFCTSQPIRCWRHSVTQFYAITKDNDNSLKCYLKENLEKVERRYILEL